MSLFKNNPVKRISDSFNVQFRVEAFNIFNRSNFNPPTDNKLFLTEAGIPVPGAGLIDATSTTSRQIQFAAEDHLVTKSLNGKQQMLCIHRK